MMKVTITVHDKAHKHLEAEAARNLKFKNKVSEVVHEAVMTYLESKGYNMTGDVTTTAIVETVTDMIEDTVSAKASNFDEEPAVKEAYDGQEIGPGLNDSDTLLSDRDNSDNPLL